MMFSISAQCFEALFFLIWEIYIFLEIGNEKFKQYTMNWWPSSSCLIKWSVPPHIISYKKTYVQAISQLHCPFSCGILTIASVWKFDGIRGFLPVKFSCKNILEGHNIIDGGWGLKMTRLLDWIEEWSIADYIICLKSIIIFLKFVCSSVPLYKIRSICFFVVCNNCSILFV